MAMVGDGDPNVTFIGDYFGFDARMFNFYPLWTDARTGIQELFTGLFHARESRIIGILYNPPGSEPQGVRTYSERACYAC